MPKTRIFPLSVASSTYASVAGWVPRLVTVEVTSIVPPGFAFVAERVWVTPRSLPAACAAAGMASHAAECQHRPECVLRPQLARPISSTSPPKTDPVWNQTFWPSTKRATVSFRLK